MHADPDTAAAEALLDWNESPLGPPLSAVTRVIQSARNLHRYPRGLMAEVTAIAADHLGVVPEQVMLTSGVDEAVDIVLSLAERAWGVRPGFDGYPERAAANGKPYHAIPLGPDWQPVGGPDRMGAGDMVFLAQPANPTGNLFRPEWVRGVRTAAQYVFLDETYGEFSRGPGVLAEAGSDPGLLVYRSFSKAFGLAGIRIGCVVAPADVIARLVPVRRFMPIDAISLNAAAGVLQDDTFVKRLTEYVLAARPALAAVLRDSGEFAEVRETETNFVLARLRDDPAELLDRLGRARIRVKNCDVLGLTGWIRVSVGSHEEHRRLATCLGASVVPA